MTSTAGASSILPPEFSSLITAPLEAQSVAFNPALATPVTTGSHEFHIPILKANAETIWVEETGELTPSEPTMGELTVVPSKTGGLVPVSREMANDSAPSSQEMIGKSLAADIVRNVDTAFLGNLASPAPKGLASLPEADADAWLNVAVVDTGAAITNLDPFNAALAACESADGNITGWLMHPTDALALANLKDATDSSKPLLENPRVIAGRPVIVSNKATPGVRWGLDAAAITTVLREDVEIAISDAPFFTSDRIAIRSTLRVGFGFHTPNRLVKMYDKV
ncbi:phage major capsid protein [Arthrobacter oryzae]|uniref:phage major capsid protein n=1 Tax=Arthrobacter oryzae TaxID=409290 RepID=UPI001606D169|nr:phage major capsid protein [Arthrobacter oryzae]